VPLKSKASSKAQPAAHEATRDFAAELCSPPRNEGRPCASRFVAFIEARRRPAIQSQFAALLGVSCAPLQGW